MNLRLLNKYEEVTYDALTRVCEPNGAHVFPKVRLADVFRLQGSGISAEHFGYGLKSHFDFLVTDRSYQPLFSVEFDGPLHKTNSEQQRRDHLKNELCEHFAYSLLRINGRYLSPDYRGLDILTYFVDAWFLEEAFYAAQQAGSVPWDEPFDISFIYSSGAGKKWTYWLSLDIQLALQNLHKEGRIGQMAPSHYVGTDAEGNYRCISWVVFDAASVIAVTTGMRDQRFPAVCKSELVSMLAMFDLYAQVRETLSGVGHHIQSRKSFFEQKLPEFQKRFAMASAASVGATV